jgi:hypothetical protein
MLSSMGRSYGQIDDHLTEWSGRQHVFFVATAPLDAGGHVNVSPKGLDTFAVLSPTRVAYLDLTGSGVETVAHLRENGRITVMFCAFEGPPRIVRLQGRGEVHDRSAPDFDELAARFPRRAGSRSVITVDVDRVADSCGYAVPILQFEAERDRLDTWAENKGEEGIAAYWQEKNASSIDGLPGLTGQRARQGSG